MPEDLVGKGCFAGTVGTGDYYEFRLECFGCHDQETRRGLPQAPFAVRWLTEPSARWFGRGPCYRHLSSFHSTLFPVSPGWPRTIGQYVALFSWVFLRQFSVAVYWTPDSRSIPINLTLLPSLLPHRSASSRSSSRLIRSRNSAAFSKSSSLAAASISLRNFLTNLGMSCSEPYSSAGSAARGTV